MIASISVEYMSRVARAQDKDTISSYRSIAATKEPISFPPLQAYLYPHFLLDKSWWR